MKAKAEIEDTKNLYDYWGERLYRSVLDDSRIIINLASKEYSKCIEKYLSDKDKYITVTFCEQSGDKLVTKGTYAKMARGEMVRYMAEKEIENPADVQTFDRLGYNFRRDLSSEKALKKLPRRRNQTIYLLTLLQILLFFSTHPNLIS